MSDTPLFRAERLLALLAEASPFGEIVVRRTLDSTNDDLRRLAASGARTGTIVVADAQTGGRGRRGRAWHSPPGLGLYLSVLLRPRAEPRLLTRWSVAAAIAACEACRALGATTVEIEWPNDMYAAGLKLGGVLAEARRADGDRQELVLGLGLNLLQRRGDFPPELDGRATSIRLAVGLEPERERLAALYLERLAALAAELEDGAWQGIARRFELLAPSARGAQVRVLGGGRAGAIAVGVSQGLDEAGALRVRADDGTIHVARLVDSVRPLAR